MLGVYRWSLVGQSDPLVVLGSFNSGEYIAYEDSKKIISQESLKMCYEMIDNAYEWVFQKKYQKFNELSKEVPFAISIGHFVTYKATKDEPIRVARINGFMEDTVLVKLDGESKQRAIPWAFVCSVGIPSNYIESVE